MIASPFQGSVLLVLVLAAIWLTVKLVQVRRGRRLASRDCACDQRSEYPGWTHGYWECNPPRIWNPRKVLDLGDGSYGISREPDWRHPDRVLTEAVAMDFAATLPGVKQVSMYSSRGRAQYEIRDGSGNVIKTL